MKISRPLDVGLAWELKKYPRCHDLDANHEQPHITFLIIIYNLLEAHSERHQYSLMCVIIRVSCSSRRLLTIVPANPCRQSRTKVGWARGKYGTRQTSCYIYYQQTNYLEPSFCEKKHSLIAPWRVAKPPSSYKHVPIPSL
jgi:hypothetical protein